MKYFQHLSCNCKNKINPTFWFVRISTKPKTLIKTNTTGHLSFYLQNSYLSIHPVVIVQQFVNDIESTGMNYEMCMTEKTRTLTKLLNKLNYKFK